MPARSHPLVIRRAIDLMESGHGASNDVLNVFVSQGLAVPECFYLLNHSAAQLKP